MNSPSEDIKDLLVTEEIGVFAATTGWGIYTVVEPDKPDQTITLTDSTGGNREQTHHDYLTTPPVRYDPVRIKIRARTYAVAYAKAEEILEVFRVNKNITLSGTLYGTIRIVEGIVQEIKDDKGRFTCRILVEPVRQEGT